MLEKWFPEIHGFEDAKKLSKQGAIAILIFTAMNLLGVLLVVFGKISPVDGHSVLAEEIQNQIIGTAIILPILLIFSWRVYKGKGWLVGGLTFVWFLAEIAVKIAAGTTNIVWLIAYAAICAMLINGIRACWWVCSSETISTEANENNDFAA